MNASAMLHTKESDKPTARLETNFGTYAAVQVGTDPAGSMVTLFIEQPAYLDALIRELSAVQAAWAIKRGEPVPA